MGERVRERGEGERREERRSIATTVLFIDENEMQYPGIICLVYEEFLLQSGMLGL